MAAQRRRFPEARELTVGAQEGLLREILRVGRIPNQAQYMSIDLVAMALEEALEHRARRLRDRYAVRSGGAHTG
jgi:hypothetical protein